MEEKSVSISDYLQGRKHNHKLYGRLLEKLKEIHAKYKNEFEGLVLTISMSAKYQTPYVMIENTSNNYTRIGGVEQEIIGAIEEVGFNYSESEDEDGWYLVNFTD